MDWGRESHGCRERQGEEGEEVSAATGGEGGGIWWPPELGKTTGFGSWELARHCPLFLSIRKKIGIGRWKTLVGGVHRGHASYA